VGSTFDSAIGAPRSVGLGSVTPFIFGPCGAATYRSSGATCVRLPRLALALPLGVARRVTWILPRRLLPPRQVWADGQSHACSDTTAPPRGAWPQRSAAEPHAGELRGMACRLQRAVSRRARFRRVRMRDRRTGELGHEPLDELHLDLPWLADRRVR